MIRSKQIRIFTRGLDLKSSTRQLLVNKIEGKKFFFNYIHRHEYKYAWKFVYAFLLNPNFSIISNIISSLNTYLRIQV